MPRDGSAGPERTTGGVAGRNGALTPTGPRNHPLAGPASEPRPIESVPSLFIDGQWVASADGACSPVVNPSDATRRHRGRRRDRRARSRQAIAAARRAFDRRDWPRPPTAERAALLDRVAGADRSRPRGAGPARDRQHRQGDAREPLGHDRRGARLPLLRGPRRQGGRTARRCRQPERLSRIVHEPVGVCGLIAPVELPAPPAELEGRAGPCRRQHGRHEAGPG